MQMYRWLAALQVLVPGFAARLRPCATAAFAAPLTGLTALEMTAYASAGSSFTTFGTQVLAAAYPHHDSAQAMQCCTWDVESSNT